MAPALPARRACDEDDLPLYASCHSDTPVGSDESVDAGAYHSLILTS